MATKQELIGKDFDTKLEKLEKLVSELEKGDLNLDQCLKKFEQGVELYQFCKSQLNKAEKKVSVLSESLKEEEI